MDWTKLYAMQKQLDHYIEENQQVHGQDLFEEKILALMVELGELANETRCFKFWSMKPQSDLDTILGEYVDGLHFILSLGLDQNLTFTGLAGKVGATSITKQFNLVMEACIGFKHVPNKENYTTIFQTFLQLGNLLGFTEEDVYQAYVEKNEINFRRQDEGY